VTDPIEPTDIEPPKTGGKKNDKPPARRRFGRERTEKEINEEEEAVRPFTKVALLGDWKRADWRPSQEDGLMVQMLKFSGYTDEDVAAAIGMSVETLQKWFSFELQNAKTLIVGDLATRAYVRARQGNDVLLMFLLKSRTNGAFSERAATASAIADGLKDVDSLSDDRRAEIIGNLIGLLNPKKQKKKATTTEGDEE